MDQALLRDGLAAMRELPRSSTDEALLCTDLHAMNVLAAEREPWLVVDPKPHAGDPHYDLTQHLLNDQERLTTDPVGWITRMAGLCDLDPHRAQAWLFARLVQEGAQHPPYAELAPRVAP